MTDCKRQAEDDLFLHSVSDACERLGIKRTKLFQLIREGHNFPIVKVGRRTLIPRSALQAFIARNMRAGDR